VSEFFLRLVSFWESFFFWAQVASERSFLLPSLTPGISLTDAGRVAQTGRAVTRIHRQKEKEDSIWASTSAWPRKIEFAISVETSSQGLASSPVGGSPLSRGKEFISEKFQFRTLKLSCLASSSSTPQIIVHPIAVRTFVSPYDPSHVYL
jgi:hypothetical protein